MLLGRSSAKKVVTTRKPIVSKASSMFQANANCFDVSASRM